MIGCIVSFYTFIGGTTTVNVTHRLQMAVMIGGIITAFGITIHMLPAGFGFVDALKLAGAHNHLNVVDFSFNLNNRYTFWSGITGGTFLALAYFGTDQSQAQRYLIAQSTTESRLGLLFNGFFKIPMQFFILLTGVMVYVFYQFHSSPLFFNSYVEKELINSSSGSEYAKLQDEWKNEYSHRQSLYEGLLSGSDLLMDQASLEQSIKHEKEIRGEVKLLIEKTLPEAESNDKDYVFIRFILDYLPKGIIGLLISMIIAAAMSATASQINSLASTTTVDFYKRLIRTQASEKHYVYASKAFTLMWGLIAMGFAFYGTLFENLIQFVNIVGSIFYGTILGIFLAAFFLKKVSGPSVFIAALLSESIVIYCFLKTDIGFLWYNVIGSAAVMILSLLIEFFKQRFTPLPKKENT